MSSSANNGYFDHNGRYPWSAQSAAAPATTISVPSQSQLLESHHFEERNVVFSSHQQKTVELANVCARFIEKRFPNHQSGGEGHISLSDRIMHTLERLFCECEVAYGALLLLQRVYEHRGGCYTPESSQFELFLSAYILSHKFLEDENYETDTWITLSLKLFTGDQIKKMQVTMLNFLNWDVAFTGEQLADWMKTISLEFAHNI